MLYITNQIIIGKPSMLDDSITESKMDGQHETRDKNRDKLEFDGNNIQLNADQ